ncbi:MAG: ssl1498 family light-harvesting-like protein [Oscillatoriaceae bacterium SKW80]|nr:ssl1498 family light-harvesting-like protein [Oscillatoriaceae bacterium SKYG93]MCX8119706.1 ssl1498 family light-harvesting-like protein [Oscillatoriaceae bacterium SKW80]MDW8452417.1 ssl1498 family light-harvesting-like protein [Oscillatoriaceae cyanobacterium SKYGB_i_bin93]HIK27610.1 ssl1498 family light-harvesting-like protein [Oscillatoriaceae cyanobacterium M7585_C2015_266]
MPYTTEEGGRLNNFATEPKMYKAEPPTKTERRNYIIMAILGTVLVGGLLFVAFSVSKVG